MRIGIDVSWAQGLSSGTATYIAGLVDALVRVDQGNEYVLFTRDPHDHGPALPGIDGPRVTRVAVDAPLTNLRQQITLPLALRRQGLDVYHSPAFFLPLALPLTWRVPTVVSIFDVNFLRLQENWRPGRRKVYLSLALQVPLTAHQSTRIITLSQASARDIATLLHVAARKISVVPAAPRNLFRAQPDPAMVADIRQRHGAFFLSVGVLAPQKNLERVLRALARQDDRRTQLVLVGHSTGAYADRLRRLACQLGMADRVVFAGVVDDDTLRALYHAAVALVYPSLGEGFGLPIIEAMCCGCPVVTSRLSSMPEVAGDAALLVDPRDTVAIAEAMAAVRAVPSVRTNLITRGYNRATQFTWEAAARGTLECYTKAVTAHAPIL